MMQGDLEVWSDKKRERLPRRVFLYETCFLLCKKKRDESEQTTVYSFKQSIQVSIALTWKDGEKSGNFDCGKTACHTSCMAAVVNREKLEMFTYITGSIYTLCPKK